ncbi:hypothetical protein LO763_22515 [Glycomyces sp. A-F 0318]|uniref:hypothetical protein n=1 Tax=Glycomyces amatae TaxID=2881355 RepID=UPI001E2E4541|nr:hypothetical protein [Glycomyces amatae]MCD0446393.1 hypothetical protein [Glycomyces amatae]
MTRSRQQLRAYYQGRLDRVAADRLADVIVALVLTERGYLDVNGWVYLHEDAIRGALDAINGSLVTRRTITLAIQDLLHRNVIEDVTGSRRPDGTVTFPPVAGMPEVPLLRFQADRYRAWSDGHASDGYDNEAGVYGHTRKLKPGQRASDDAKRAHQEAQEHGQIANHGPLPDGYTFVTAHHRRYRDQSGGPALRSYAPGDDAGDDFDEDDADAYHRYT